MMYWIVGDNSQVLVLAKSEFRTKQQLRDAFKEARQLVSEGALRGAEAWDDETNGRLASAGETEIGAGYV